MSSATDTLAAATELRTAIEARLLGQDSTTARKRTATVLRAFGRPRLTRRRRVELEQALQRVGLEVTPPIRSWDKDGWLEFSIVGGPISSTAPPTQIAAWHEFNFTGSGEGGPLGEWLRCLRQTIAKERQLVWTDSRIATVVTFAGWIRRGDGFYEGWGSISRLKNPVDRAALLGDPRTAARFDRRGVHALQGSPVVISPDLGLAIDDLAGGIGPTPIPLDDPDHGEEPILWAGLRGLKPEATIEALVASRRSMWRRLGFPRAPERQRILGGAGRVDLIAGDVVGEAKRAVTLRDGPGQIERYLRHLETVDHRPRSKLRGVLLQCSAKTSRAVEDRLNGSAFDIQLWSVTKNRRWRLSRLV